MKKNILYYLILIFISHSQTFGQYSNVPDINSLKTFGTMGKELQILKKNSETDLFSYKGKGTLTHMWFGGSFKGYEDTQIRIYVDGEQKASINMKLFLGHGIGFNDNHAPWGTERIGKTGRRFTNV